MTPSEAVIETQLRLWVQSINGKCIKLPALLYRGIPDRMVLLPNGQVWFIELKREKAKTTKQVAVGQTAWFEFLRNYGFNYIRISGKQQLKEFIDARSKDPV